MLQSQRPALSDRQPVLFRHLPPQRSLRLSRGVWGAPLVVLGGQLAISLPQGDAVQDEDFVGIIARELAAPKVCGR